MRSDGLTTATLYTSSTFEVIIISNSYWKNHLNNIKGLVWVVHLYLSDCELESNCPDLVSLFYAYFSLLLFLEDNYLPGSPFEWHFYYFQPPLFCMGHRDGVKSKRGAGSKFTARVSKLNVPQCTDGSYLPTMAFPPPSPSSWHSWLGFIEIALLSPWQPLSHGEISNSP